MHRAFAILRIVAAGREVGLSLQQVAQATGLSRPTAHRILQMLVAEGVAEQSLRTRRYLVGEQIPMLALARPRRSMLEDVAPPVLDRLAREIGDTVFLTVRTQLDTLCLARRLGSYPIQVLVIEVGARRPLGVSTAGLAILSGLPPEEAVQILNTNGPRISTFGTNSSMAAALVEDGRHRGYALSDPGLVPGTKALSVLIPSSGDGAAAVLTVAAIRKRLAPWRERTVAEMLRSAGIEIAQDVDTRKRRSRDKALTSSRDSVRQRGGNCV